MKNLIKAVLAWISGLITGVVIVKKLYTEILIRKENEAEKFYVFVQLLNRWLLLKQHRKNIADYLKERKYQKVAIYGMGQLGERLFDELNNSGIDVVFGIDRNKDRIDCCLDIYAPEEDLPYADIVIVTAITDYSKIVWFLSRKIKYPIESLEKIIVELGQEDGE